MHIRGIVSVKVLVTYQYLFLSFKSVQMYSKLQWIRLTQNLGIFSVVAIFCSWIKINLSHKLKQLSNLVQLNRILIVPSNLKSISYAMNESWFYQRFELMVPIHRHHHLALNGGCSIDVHPVVLLVQLQNWWYSWVLLHLALDQMMAFESIWISVVPLLIELMKLVVHSIYLNFHWLLMTVAIEVFAAFHSSIQ